VLGIEGHETSPRAGNGKRSFCKIFTFCGTEILAQECPDSDGLCVEEFGWGVRLARCFRRPKVAAASRRCSPPALNISHLQPHYSGHRKSSSAGKLSLSLRGLFGGSAAGRRCHFRGISSDVAVDWRETVCRLSNRVPAGNRRARGGFLPWRRRARWRHGRRW